MWIRLVTSHADPTKVVDIRNLYNSQELSDFFEAQKGHRFHHLLEADDDSGDIVFLTGWDSLEEMNEAFESDDHKRVGGLFKQYLVAPSERKVYQVHE